MAYSGKYIDRSPSIKPAGTRNYSEEASVANCLKYVSLEEELNAIVSPIAKFEEKKSVRSPPTADMYGGYYTQVRSLMSPGKKFFFQELENELKETAYSSYWKSQLGALPDQTPGLPFGMVPEEVVFGKPTGKDIITAQDLINPKITYGETKLLAELGHELYRKTHRSFFPGEQKINDYSQLPNLQKRIHGICSLAGPKKTSVSDVLHQSDLKNVIVGPQNLAKYKQKFASRMGKRSSKSDSLPSLPTGHVFGVRKDMHEPTVEQILTGCDVNSDKIKLNKAIAYIYRLRKSFQNRFPPFSFVNFAAAFRDGDQKQCSCLPLKIFYQICEEEGLDLDHAIIESLLRKLDIIHGKNDLVKYLSFISLLDEKQPLPDLGKVEASSGKRSTNMMTSYQKYHLENLGKFGEIGNVRPAGIPVSPLRYTYNYLKHQGLIKTNINDFPASTSVENCISPGLFPSLGVSHRDFFQPRTKEYIKDIYQRVGVELSDDVFEKLWAEAVRRDGERVCLETFRNILDEITATKLLQGAEV